MRVAQDDWQILCVSTEKQQLVLGAGEEFEQNLHINFLKFAYIC